MRLFITTILGLILALPIFVQAQTTETILECTVPAPVENYVALVLRDKTIVEGKDALAFVILDKKAKTQQAYQTVSEKGQIEIDMKSGAINIFGLGQNFAQDAGALKDVASLSLNYNELNEVFEGVIIAGGNLYPVVCAKPKAP